MRRLFIGAFLSADLFATSVARTIDGLGHGVGAVEVVTVLFTLEHGIGVQRFLDLLLQIEGGKLEEPYGLLQLRCHRQLLAHLQD